MAGLLAANWPDSIILEPSLADGRPAEKAASCERRATSNKFPFWPIR